MSILLILCVLAAAGWLAMSVARRGPTDDPGDSVAAYSRAMAALDPGTDGPRAAPRRAPARPRTTARTPSSRAPARASRPAVHRAAGRTSSAAPRRRPVRR